MGLSAKEDGSKAAPMEGRGALRQRVDHGIPELSSLRLHCDTLFPALMGYFFPQERHSNYF